MLTKQDLQQIEKLVTGSEERVTKNLTKRIDQLDDKISTLDDKISTLDDKIEATEARLTDKIEATKQEIIEGVNDLIQNSIIPQLDDKVGRTEYKKDISQIRSHLGLISK